MTADKVVALLGVSLCLMLAWRNLRSDPVGAQRKLAMGAVWVALFVGVTVLATLLVGRV